jgi:hypothetical protein
VFSRKIQTNPEPQTIELFMSVFHVVEWTVTEAGTKAKSVRKIGDDWFDEDVVVNNHLVGRFNGITSVSTHDCVSGVRSNFS